MGDCASATPTLVRYIFGTNGSITGLLIVAICRFYAVLQNPPKFSFGNKFFLKTKTKK